MEYYIDDGVIYPVAPDRLEEFLRDHPNAQPYDKEQADQQVETNIAEPVIEEQPDPFIGPMVEEDPVLDAPISTAISPRQQEIKDIEKIQEFSNKVDSSPVVEKFSDLEKSIDEIINNYKKEYKDTNFEFEKTRGNNIRMKGESGIEEIIPLRDINFDGNFHKKINDFIAKNANEEVRNKTKPIENNIESFLNNQLNVDEEGWRWYGQAAGDDIRKKGVQSLEHYIETFGQEGLRKELRKNWNKNNIQPGTRDFFSLEDTMEIAGVSDYRYDQIFDEAISNQVSKEKRNEFEFKRNELKEEITQRYGDNFLSKIDDDGVDYRDLPEYEQISNLYFKQAIDELDDEQVLIANKNADSLKKSYELARLIEANGNANDIANLKSEIKTLQSDASNLLQEYNGKNTNLFFDYSEGASRIAPPKKEEEEEPKGESVQKEYDDFISELSILKSEDFQGLQERFNINSLTKDELDERLNKTHNLAVGGYDSENPNKDSRSQFITKLINLGYEYDKEKESFTDVKMSDLVSLSEHSSVIKQYIDPDAKPTISMDLGAATINLREQVKINSVERKALTDMYLLNIDPADMRRTSGGKGERDTFWNDTKRFASSFYEGAIETFTKDQNTIFSKSDKLAQVEKIGDELGIKWNEEQQKNFKETYAEFTGKTLGALPQIATEFAILNYVTGGLATATGLSQSLMAMRVGRLYKNGKQVSHAVVNAKALKKGYSLNPRGLEQFYDDFGYTLKGATLPEKANALIITSLIEEGKMQFMGLPTGSGFAFGMAGQTFASVTNRFGLYFTEKSGLQALNGALKLVRGGISFGIAAPTASNLEAAIEDIIGGKDFQTFIDEHYRELSGEEIFRRSLGEFLTGFGFAIGHLKRADFAVTMTQQKALLAKARRLVKEEEAKPEKERDYSKIEKYNNLASAVGRKLDIAAGYYRYFTPEILVKRVEKDLKKNKDRAVEEYGEFWETKVQIGNKGLGDSGAAIKNINGKKTLVVNALSWRNKGLIPHEMAHFYSEKAGFTEEEFEKLYDIVELHADAALKERYTEKGYKSFKDFIETEYKKVGEKGALGSEKIANLIEFLSSDKSIMKNIIENNAFYGFEQGIKSFYERRLQDKGFFKGKEIGFQDAQDVMNALFRIANSTGKRGVSRQWEQLRNLVQFNNEIVDVKRNKIVGKSNVKKSSLDLVVEKQKELQKETKENEQIYQRTDRLFNEAFEKGNWEKNKKSIAFELAYEFEGNVIGRLNKLKRLDKLKGFTNADIKEIALEFVTAEKEGLRSAIEAFKPSRMIDPVTKKPSIATYLESTTAQGKLIDVKLRKFYQEHPSYGRLFKGLDEIKELVYQPSMEIAEIKEGAKINPLELRSVDGKEQKTNFENSIKTSFDKFTNEEIADLNFNKLKDLAPEVTAEFFGIPKEKLISPTKNLTYSQKIKDGIRVASEANNVQKVINKNAIELLALLPKTNIVPETSINKVDVRRNIVGMSLGIPNSLLKVFYNKTNKRSKGLKSQTAVFELKKDLSIKKFKEAFGITIGGELNIYDRQIGQRLKNMASLTGKLITNKAVRNILAGKEVNNIINDIAAGKSDKMSTLNLSQLNKDIQSILVPTTNLIKQKLLNNPDIFKIIPKKEIFKIVDKTFKDKTLEKDISESEEVARIYESVLERELAEKNGLKVSDISFYEKASMARYTARYEKEGIIDQYKTKKQRDNTIDLARKRSFETKILNKFPKNTPKFIKDRFVDTFGANTRGWERDGKQVNKGKEGAEKFIEKEYPGYTGSNKKYKKEYDAVWWPTNWGGKSGVKKPFLELINKLEKEGASESEKDTQLLALFNKVMTNPNGKYTYTETVKANQQFLTDYLKATRDVYNETLKENRKNIKISKEYKSLTTKERKEALLQGEIDARVDMYRHYQIQTNIASGIMKGSIPVTSISSIASPIKSEKEKGLHWEHNMQLNNFSEFFFDINKKGGKDSDIAILVSNASQALIPYSLKLSNDSAEKGGTTGYGKFYGKDGLATLSSNPEMNFITNPNVASHQIRTVGKSTGLRLAEQIVNTVKKEVLIRRLNEMNESSDKVIIEQVLKNKSSFNKVKNNNRKILESVTGKSSLNLSNGEIIDKIKNIDKAIELARDKKKKKKGISVLDFDDTVAKTKSKVIVYAPAFKPGTSREVSMKLTPAEFAKRHAELERMGASFNFSEFTKVIKGKKGPLFNKLEKAVNKFGNENVFILTARPQESAEAIRQFLEGMGVNLKIENITGLEDGRPSAKAQWVIDKAAEGYNDFYFADDATANTKAVKKVLDIIDVKSNIQIAKSSLNLSKDINEMIEYSTGIGREKTYSAAKAGLTGKGRSHWKLYMPSRASDFHSLTNALIGKGVKGLENRKWIQENLVKPFSRGDLAFNTERRTKLADYFVLRNQLKETGSKYRDMFKKNPLNNSIEKGEVWTNQHAVRVYNWAKQGVLPKDISKTDAKKLVDHVNNNPKLKAFAEELVNLHKGEGYPEPREMWLSETITQDILLGGKKTSRNKHMKEFIENADIVFSPENLNKMEAAFGKAWRTAMENNLEAMKTGSNRPSWGEGNKWESDFLDWVNGSVGSTMFINVRSSLLQQVSLTNYVNVTDNNIFAAGKAFANNKQFRKDYIDLMNDKWSLNRRDGLRYNVQEAEIAELFATTRNKPAALINWALKKGFILTKFMDSHATAFGGASFYRNRTNTYLKQVNPGTGKKYTKQEAENKAKEDWREMSDATQQTSRMDRVSPEQRSVTGRLVLPFSTVQLAYGRRYIDDAARDLINKRYDHLHKGENSALKKIGQIIYGTAIQGAVFHGLQQAIFKVIFDDGNTLDGEELEVANAILDGILVGSGIAGKAVAVFKNWAIAMEKESKKKNPQYTDTATEFLKISPPIDKKYRQFKGALRELQYNMDDIDELSLNNPALNATTKIIESVTNAPVDNLLINMQNVEAALEEDRANWQRPFLMSGWSPWNLEDDKKRKTKKRKKGFNLDFDFNTDFDLDFDVDF